MHRLSVVVFLAINTLLTSFCNAVPLKAPEMPENCAGKNMCFTKDPNYPQTVIDDLLKKIHTSYVENQKPIEDRIGGEDGDNECESRVNMKPIYEIVDEDDNLRFVVQADKFNQIIRTEECVNPGRITEPTQNFDSQVLGVANLHCVQCTLNYRFLVLSLDGERLETADMKGGVPVCCSCQKK